MAKKVIAILLVLTMVLSFAACGNDAADPTKAPSGGDNKPAEKTKIVMANHMAGEAGTAAFWEGLEKDFEAKYPEYDLEYLIAGYNDMVSQVTTTVGGGGQVDVIIGEITWGIQFAEAGIISPLNVVMDDSFIDSIHKEVVGDYTYYADGDIYGFPMYFSNMVFFYNTDMAEAAGLDITKTPTTEAELWAWMDAFSKLKTATGEKVYPVGIPYAEAAAPGTFMNAFVKAFGGDVLDANAKESIDNTGFDEWLDFMLELDKKGYNPQSQLPKDLRNSLAVGTVAMTLDQSWGISGVAAVDPTAYDHIQTFAVPAMGSNGNGKSLISAHSIYVTGLDEKTQAGTEALIKYIMTEEVVGDYMTNTNPALSSGLTTLDVEPLEIFDGIGNVFDNIAVQPAHKNLSAVQIDLCTLLNAVVVNGKSVDEAIEAFKKEAAVLLK